MDEFSTEAAALFEYSASFRGPHAETRPGIQTDFEVGNFLNLKKFLNFHVSLKDFTIFEESWFWFVKDSSFLEKDNLKDKISRPKPPEAVEVSNIPLPPSKSENPTKEDDEVQIIEPENKNGSGTQPFDQGASSSKDFISDYPAFESFDNNISASR